MKNIFTLCQRLNMNFPSQKDVVDDRGRWCHHFTSTRLCCSLSDSKSILGTLQPENTDVRVAYVVLVGNTRTSQGCSKTRSVNHSAIEGETGTSPSPGLRCPIVTSCTIEKAAPVAHPHHLSETVSQVGDIVTKDRP